MAEEIGYSIVGDKEKQQSDVVDYNIREEQTKDAFNTDNANNQTTTGMANVIPGINAPKLIASTSIMGGASGGGSILTSEAGYKRSTDPGTSYEEYPLISFSSPGGDLYQENDYVHCDSGTYLIVFNAHITNVNVNSALFELRYYDANGYIGYVAHWLGGKEVSGSAVFTFNTGYYLRLYGQLNYGTVGANIKLNFIKLA